MISQALLQVMDLSIKPETTPNFFSVFLQLPDLTPMQVSLACLLNMTAARFLSLFFSAKWLTWTTQLSGFTHLFLSLVVEICCILFVTVGASFGTSLPMRHHLPSLVLTAQVKLKLFLLSCAPPLIFICFTPPQWLILFSCQHLFACQPSPLKIALCGAMKPEAKWSTFMLLSTPQLDLG